ncbi:MAG: hypothetical protein ACI3XZ_02090 [Butyricicoccus sp.]
MQVQALLPAPRQNNTIRSSAAASGVRSTDGVVFPFQIEPATLGFDLVLGASFMCWHLYCYAITRWSKLFIACSDFLKNPSALTMPSRRYQLFAGSSPYQIIQMASFSLPLDTSLRTICRSQQLFSSPFIMVVTEIHSRFNFSGWSGIPRLTSCDMLVTLTLARNFPRRWTKENERMSFFEKNRQSIQ